MQIFLKWNKFKEQWKYSIKNTEYVIPHNKIKLRPNISEISVNGQHIDYKEIISKFIYTH
jgi:fructose-1,6-bisphosphatase